MPPNGLAYRSIHDVDVLAGRRHQVVPCGPGGSVLDYVPFYFGPRSPMLLRLTSGRVAGFAEGQASLVYLTSTVQSVREARCRFVFTDGHALATRTRWFADLAQLSEVDWATAASDYWADTAKDPDRQRRKQAEFLVHRTLPWSLILEIGVLDEAAAARVQSILGESERPLQPEVRIRRSWYY